MSSRTRLMVLFVSMPVVAFVLIGGFLGDAIAREGPYQHLRVFEDVVSLIVNNYVEEVDIEEVMRGAMRGLSEGLDADSAYLRPDQVRQLESGAPLPEADVGLELTRQYYLRVIAARDGSPAARAGLRPGDYVRAINGRSTRDLSVFEGTRLLFGLPGSTVTLTVIRGNAAEPHDVPLAREKIAPLRPTSRMAASGIGYVRVAEFVAATPKDIAGRVADLTRGGASRLVVDLRNTAKGPFTAGIAAARLFIASGTVTQRERRDAPREVVVTQSGDGALKLPVVVLVNAGTAGAAELFAGALKENHRATLVGQRTIGRAAEQKLVKLADGSGLWLSATRYLMPSGTPLHEKGLEPDVEVTEPEVEFGSTAASDPILQKAIEQLAGKRAA